MTGNDSILEMSDEGDLSSCLRLEIPESARIGQSPARCLLTPEAIFLLENAGLRPWRIQLAFDIPAPSAVGSVLILADDRPLGRFYACKGEADTTFTTEPFLLSTGGHSLRFLLENGLQELPVQKIRLTGYPLQHRELVESFPFDLYQRYEAIREILDSLYAGREESDRSSIRILDYGGLMGGSVGHMGSIADFLPSFSTVVADTRECGLPGFVRINPGEFPFGEKEFSVVVSLDVLEHVPRPDRKSFLQAVLGAAGDWAIVGCPVDSPSVRDAEAALRTFIEHYTGYKQVFLEEHERFVLPSEEEITDLLQQMGYEYLALPNGYLPRWFWMQCVTFFASTAQNSQLQEKINRFYNRNFFPLDKTLPSYRTLFLVNVGRQGRLADFDARTWISRPGDGPPEHWAAEAHLMLELFQLQHWAEKDRRLERLSATLYDREKLILYQQNHIQNIESEAAHLRQYSRQLEKERQEVDRQKAGMETHARNLEEHIRHLDRELLLQSDRLHSAGADLQQQEHRIQGQSEQIRELEERNALLQRRLDSPRLAEVLSSPWRWIRKWVRSSRR